MSGGDNIQGDRTLMHGVDPDGEERAIAVTRTGEIRSSGAAAPAPLASTPVKRTVQTPMSGVVEEVYTVTPGKTLTIQTLAAGSATGTNGSKVELWKKNGAGYEFIAGLYVDGASAPPLSLGNEIIGDGVVAVALRRTALGGGAREIFGRWEGYES